MSKRSKLEHGGDLGREGVAKLLEHLAAGLRSGTVNLASAGEHLMLEPAEFLRFQLCAKRKRERQSITLELDWVSEPRLVIESNEISVTSTPESTASSVKVDDSKLADLRLDAELLAALEKQRLYRLAQAVGIDGRSQLSKSALARAVAEREHGRWLEPRDLVVIATRLEVDDPEALSVSELAERVQEAASRRAA